MSGFFHTILSLWGSFLGLSVHKDSPSSFLRVVHCMNGPMYLSILLSTGSPALFYT